jgi:hypothetical protein
MLFFSARFSIIPIVHEESTGRQGTAMAPLKRIFSQIVRSLGQDDHSTEFKRFQRAIRKNPEDCGLRAEFAKYCLRHHFSQPDTAATGHAYEALHHFETLSKSETFDPEVFYLVGRYLQVNGGEKALEVYREGIRRFNRHVEADPAFKQEYGETSLAIALNLLVLQNGEMDTELEKFFVSLRKPGDLHAKRAQLEREMEKADPDPSRVQELHKEIGHLKKDRAKKS